MEGKEKVLKNADKEARGTLEARREDLEGSAAQEPPEPEGESLTRRGERHFLHFAGFVAPGAKHPLLCVVSWCEACDKNSIQKGQKYDICISRQRGPWGNALSPVRRVLPDWESPHFQGVSAWEEGPSDAGSYRLAPVRGESAC